MKSTVLFAALLLGQNPADKPAVPQVAVPRDLQVKNRAGRDGLGLETFACLEMAANVQGIGELHGFTRKMEGEKGGAYPEKVAAELKRLAPGVDFAQYEGHSLAFLEPFLRAGVPVTVSYTHSPRYGGTIATMVLLVHLDKERAAVLDPNFPGTLEWMDRAEFARRFGGWAVVLLGSHGASKEGGSP